MPNTAIEALTKLEEVLDAASVAVADAADALAIDGVNAGSPDVNPDATKAGVFGIESSDPKIIEATLRIAVAVNQQVHIDYRDQFGEHTAGRAILPTEFVEGAGFTLAWVVATDEYRDGDVRRFRLDRIERVAC